MSTAINFGLDVQPVSHAEFLRRHKQLGVLFAAELSRPEKPRTRAADRTRSKRWRAGTKRGRRQVAAARKLGLPNPFAKPKEPFQGWCAMGWTSDTDDNPEAPSGM